MFSCIALNRCQCFSELWQHSKYFIYPSLLVIRKMCRVRELLSVAIVLSAIVLFANLAIAQEPTSKVVCNTLNITKLATASKPPGGIDVLGIISNDNSTLTYDSVGAVGEFYDSNDKLVGIESGTAEFSTLEPGESSPLKIMTDVSNQTLDHYTITCRTTEGRPSPQLP